MLKATVVKSVCALAAVATLATACTKSMAGHMSGSNVSVVATSITTTATLRTALNALLSEHVILAAAATGAALDGRDAEFKAAAGALDANSVDIARAIGSVYGTEAEQAFLPLWRRHIGFAVDYTVGVATKDQVKQQKAVSDLMAYTQDFGAFLASANPNLPKSVVADLDKFTGKADAAAAGLRTTLNLSLREHAYLAGAATNAALGGREAEFKAAAGALDANSVDIAKAIGSVYGKDAEQAFLPLWRRHIGFFVDYTVGVATKDKAKQDKAVGDLTGYTQDFGAFLQSANPNLPKQVVADLVKHHVITLKSVVDAQATKDQAGAYTAMRAAAGHMQMIADPLAVAIVKQFPDRYTASAR